ncbi:MAG: class I SAM-dependent methyltransferase [Anaerolineales bacterium]
MEHSDHVRLLRGGIPEPGGVWADFGSGTGAFTLALGELIGPGGTIYSVDRDARALREQEQALASRFPRAMAIAPVTVHSQVGDFTQPLDLPPLDGLVIANALHFVRDKEPVVRLLKSYLKPEGRLVVVEYNVDAGNPWVPHPFSFETWKTLAARCGFKHTQLLVTQPSRFLREFYSASSWE